MKKILITLTLILIVAAPSCVAAQSSETDSFGTQTRNFFNKVFQGEKYEYEKRIETPKAVPSEEIVPSEQERNVPSVEVEASPVAPSQLRETKPTDREISTSLEAEPSVSPVQRLGEPVEQETGEGRTIFNRVKNVFRAEEGPVGPDKFSPAEEAQVPEEIRVKLEQKRIEVQEKIRVHYEEVEAIRNEAVERVQERKQEFEEKIQGIRDEQKRILANRIHDKVYDIQDRTIENFNKTLNKLDTIVANISTRADKAESEGFNVENVRSAVSNAESRIAEARESVKTALGKGYSPEGTNLETLREEFHSIRDELKNDLENVRNMVRSAHEAARSAAEELTRILESE